MPAYPPLIPNNLKPLHIYRQLLREISYLPPSIADTIRRIVSERFHRDKVKQSIDPQVRIARGRSALRKIRDANNGNGTAMFGLLTRGFARSGASRMRLLAQLTAKDGPSDSKALSEAVAALDRSPDSHAPGSTTPKNRPYAWMDRLDKKKLTQFASSQKQQQNLVGSNTLPGFKDIKVLRENFHVPELNIWGKPPAENVVRSKKAMVWRKALDETLPPLPRSRWELLRDLANGAQETEQWKVPARRPAAKLLSGPAEEPEWDWKAYALQPVGHLEKRSLLRRARFSDPRGDGNPFTIRNKLSPTLSARWYRRAYQIIWMNSAIMERDPNTLKYNITWGGKLNNYPAPTDRQLEFLADATVETRKKKQGRPQ